MDSKSDSKNSHANHIFMFFVVCMIGILANPGFPLLKVEPAKAAAQEKVFLPVAVNGNILQDSPSPVPSPSYDGWLSYLNYYRSLSGLLPVAENKLWSDGSWYHSRYMVKNDHVAHGEDPGNSWYTQEGDLAAQSSNLVASYSLTASDNFAIDSWMQAPFHALYVLNPALKQVGFGSFREEDGGLQMGATLDVLRGQGEIQSSTGFPIYWPGKGATVPIGSYWGEYPDPLTSCEGFVSPAGLPIILQLGEGNLSPDVSAHSFAQGNTQLEHCIFDESSYQNGDGVAQALGRAILDTGDAIVLIPRAPLTPGSTYAVSITANGQNYTWKFSVAGQPSQMGTLSGSVTAGFLIPEFGLEGLNPR